MFLKHKYETPHQAGCSALGRVLELPSFASRRATMLSVRLIRHLSHPHFFLLFRTVLFSLDPIFKFLQALPLGCDCAFHSGREHQDLLPPEGRIVSDTYISQKSQTSQILYLYVRCHRLMSRSIVIFCHTKVGKLRASGRGASPPQGGSPAAPFLVF